ncbi:MAG: hypothetical protein ACM31D_06395 [Bacteroidota bacterium]
MLSSVRALVGMAITLSGLVLSQGVRAQRPEDAMNMAFAVDPKAAKTFAFEKPLDRSDIVLLGTTVTIDRELRSNGGNILIVADRLFVDAPIDTRVYATPIPRYWDLPEPGVRSQSLEYWTQWAPNIRRAFDNLYLWTEKYDPKSHSYKFFSATRSEMSKKTLAFPTMPYGFVPLSSNGLPPWEGIPANGPKAPDDFDREAFKSGDINIYAREIIFCNECVRPQFTFRNSQDGDPFDKESIRFLVAAGLKGGRGGIGSILPCTYDQPSPGRFQLDCESHNIRDILGGLSGAPGRGGDAGNIFIRFIGNNAAAERERALQRGLNECAPDDCASANFESTFGRSIAALTDVAGGRPAHTKLLRTPSFNSLAREGTRTLFRGEGNDIAPLEQLLGKAGSLTIESLSPEEALGQIAVHLTGIDNNPKYNVQLLIKDLADHRQANSPVVRDQLATFLTNLLIRRQLELLATLPSALETDSEGIISGDLLSGLECEGSSVPGLTTVEFELVRRICEFRPYRNEGALRSYFYRTGGLFRPVEVAATTDFQSERIVAAVQQNTRALEELRDATDQVAQMLFDYVTEETRQRYLVTLQRMETSLAEANAALASQGDSLKHLLAIGRLAEGATKGAIAAWGSGNYVAFSGAAVEAGGKVVEFFGVLNGKDITAPQREAIARIKRQISNVEREFLAFQQESAAIKERLMAQRNELLRQVLTARAVIQNARRNVVFDFEGLLRGALIMYLADPYRQQNTLLSAIYAIQDAVTNFPNQSLSFLPLRHVIDCRGQQPISEFGSLPPKTPIGCFVVSAPNVNTFVVTSRRGRLRNFPLAVVAAGSGSFLMSFNWLFSPEDIDKRFTGAVVRGWLPDKAALRLP